jgi:hypothetical protein
MLPDSLTNEKGAAVKQASPLWYPLVIHAAQDQRCTTEDENG